MIEEGDQIKIGHAWPILISANSIWWPIHVKVFNLPACITLSEPDTGQYPGFLWEKQIMRVTIFFL